MSLYGENYNEYTETNSESQKARIDSAINNAKEGTLDTEEWQKELETFKSEIDDLQTKILSGTKVDFKTPDSINHFYRLDGDKIIFQIDQVRSYLSDVLKRLQWMKVQKFWEVSKEKNFTWTILAIQIALKAMSVDPKNPKEYNIWEINWEYNDITKEAIKKFQLDQKIGNDWKPWKLTIEKLIAAIDNLTNNKKIEQKEYESLKKDVSNIVEESIVFSSTQWVFLNQSKEALTIYIMEWKLNTWKSELYESMLNNLANNPFNWKLKYLLQNSDKSLKDNVQRIKFQENRQRMALQRNLNINQNSKETIQESPTSISEDIFQELLAMEWWQWYVAQVHKKFWENFATWPYGMVYKHIDSQGNLLKKPIPFKEWERMTKQWALDNAKAYYNKKAREWAKNLKDAWCNYNQDQLDALVSASWWTVKSYERLKNFVLSHWNNLKEVFEFLKTFARRDSKWNLLGWLIARRNLEANWFMWNTEKSYGEYQNDYFQQRKKSA